ncbi:Hypothetical predicted protein [Scomber scombrus]|uniref:Uncharacterized protein n=1 Tax=Scomber scombrus TaxID=13677 RepID=A0AAV1PJS7_SCOSC
MELNDSEANRFCESNDSREKHRRAQQKGHVTVFVSTYPPIYRHCSQLLSNKWRCKKEKNKQEHRSDFLRLETERFRCIKSCSQKKTDVISVCVKNDLIHSGEDVDRWIEGWMYVCMYGRRDEHTFGVDLSVNCHNCQNGTSDTQLGDVGEELLLVDESVVIHTSSQRANAACVFPLPVEPYGTLQRRLSNCL